MDIRAAIERCGGFASTLQLRADGFSEHDLTQAVRTEAVARPRRGWYSTLSATDPRFRAVRIGGRLTGTSALGVLNAWMLDRPTTLHVAIEPGTSRLRHDAGDVRLHWVTVTVPPVSVAVVGVADAALQVVLSEPLETAVSCLDWALSTNRLDLIDFEKLLLRLPQTARSISDWVDPASQSVLESVARVRLRRRGWSVRSQVRVGDLQSIDLVVDGHVALELDGREHHQDRFEVDRAKDLEIAIEGRHALRVSYLMMKTSWPRVERAIEAALVARHRPPVGNSAGTAHLPSGGRRTRAQAALAAELPTRPRE